MQAHRRALALRLALGALLLGINAAMVLSGGHWPLPFAGP